MMSKRFLLILEIIWIITGTLCVAAGIRYLIKDGGKMFYIFPLMALVSYLFAWIRHRERKKS
jgi:superfamily II helicase